MTDAQLPIPSSVAEITPDWATEVLRASGVLVDGRVAAVRSTPLGEQGQTSEVHRVELTYEGDAGDAPTSVIAKVPPPNPQVRAVQQSLGAYYREVGFYRDLGSHAGIAVPASYFAEMNPDNGDFLLLLEDMAECRVGELWESDIADVREVTDAIAKMHARWWNSEELRAFAWLPQHDDARYHEMLGAAVKMSLPATLERYPDEFGGYLGELAQRLVDGWTEWSTFEADDPFTLIHADLHPKQIFFAGETGGRFAVFDWQSVVSGRPTFDLARLLLKGLRPAELRAHRDELLERYHAGLVAEGVDISLEAVRDEWRRSLLQTLAYTVFVLAQTNVEALEVAASARGVDYRERLITDLAESLRDNDVHEVLPGA